MYQTILIIYITNAVILISLIMLQNSKDANTGSRFLAGSVSSTLFGPSGSGNLIKYITAMLAILFFILSLILGSITNTHGQKLVNNDSSQILSKPANNM